MKPRPSFRQWFETQEGKWEALVFDIDGTLIRGGHPIKDSGQLLENLRRRGVPFSLLTNDGSHSPEQKCRELANSGVSVGPEEIVSASHGLAEVVESKSLGDGHVFVMGKLGTPCYAKAAGLRPTREPNRLPDCVGVIVGEDDYDWEPTLNAVVNFFVRNPAAVLIVPNPDCYFAVSEEEIRLAAGAATHCILHVLEAHGVTIEPVYLGKPYHPIFLHNHRAIESRLQRPLARDRVLMVGDYLESDIKGAKDFGYRAALVLSGITRAGNARKGPVKPDFIFESV